MKAKESTEFWVSLVIQSWDCHQDGGEGWGQGAVLFELNWDTCWKQWFLNNQIPLNKEKDKFC